jgi:Tol biopolymer transport system component
VRLQPGSTIGRYEVIERIGAGGMGEVYRARDTHLDRTVALKIIAASFAQDPTSQPRFERERRVAASLEHPHVCRLLDAGHESGVEYLAMEYLQGESLASRLTRGPLPLVVAIGYAIEIASALNYAHRLGVVHRDLKPANVYLTPGGAKVLDFGLSKLRQADAGRTPLQADTAPLAPAATQVGTIVGSAPYMAPERLEGREADHRTDVWGFGLILYEMCTGRRTFEASSPAALIAAILSGETPSMNLVGPKSDDVEWIVQKCLQKNPDDRWQAMGDVEVLLKRIVAGHGFPRAARRSRVPRVAVGIAAIACVVAAVGGALSLVGRDRPRSASAAFAIPPPNGGTFTPTEGSVQSAQLALSPDGQSLAFVAAGADGVSQIWIRHLDSLHPTPVAGTAGATYPFWSPDSRALGFFARGLLRRIDLSGGPARTIAAAPNGRGGAWNTDGVILFAPETTGGIHRVSSNGGETTPQTRVDRSRGQTSHRWPLFLPDGRQFLFFARSENETDEGIYLASLDRDGATLVTNSSVGAAYLPPREMVLFESDGALLARVFDPQQGRLTGDPVVVIDAVAGSSNFYGAFSASTTGVIAYGSPAVTSDIVWFDRRGQRLATAVTAGQYVDFHLSPDSQSLALAAIDRDTGRSDLYLLDLARGTRLRLTSARATDATPIWSPDGGRLVFRSNRERVHDLYARDLRGTKPETLLLSTGQAKYPTSWAPDGRSIVYHTRDNTTRWDIMMSGADGSAPRPLVRSPFNEMQAQLSPDGQWLAYTSDESSRPEVYVRSLSGTGPRLQMSVNGGSDPKWRRDGSELFYVAADGRLMSVALRTRGAALEPSAPQALFHVPDMLVSPPYTSPYDVTSDGSRFLVRVAVEQVRSMPLTVLLGWSPPQG